MHGSESSPTTSTQARKLVQAAAFAAALVPLGAVTSEASHIPLEETVDCSSQGTGCAGTFYNFGSGHSVESFTWNFYDTDLSRLVYSLRIAGNVAQDAEFTLFTDDQIVNVADGLALTGSAVTEYAHYECVPTFRAGQCGFFDVTLKENDALAFMGGFSVVITWFGAGSSDVPPEFPEGATTALYASDYANFDRALHNANYLPLSSTELLVRGGPEYELGRFGVVTVANPVPEPSTLVMLVLGAAFLTIATRFSL